MTNSTPDISRSRVGRSAVAALVVSLLAAAIARPSGAQPGRMMESVLSYKTVKVADGVYAFITPEERTGFQSGNSIAIVGDDGVLVFDTGNIPSSTRRQIAEIRKLTDKPVRYVVNSHWHPDHNLGNAEYRAAFPAVTIIGTSATRAGVLERVPTYFNQMKAFGPTDSLMRLRLASGKMRDGSDMPASVRLMWGLVTRDFGEFMPDMLTATPLAPELTFDDSLTVTLGRREVKVVRPGRGNTEGDAYAYVPDANVLLTGDLVTVPCPFPSTSFFSDWIAALDQLEARKAAVIVPGHGDVQHDYQYVALTRELLAYTRDKARAAARSGRTFEEFQKELDFAPFVERFAGGDPVRIDAFNSFYRDSGALRAYAEAKYLVQAPIPP
jgi:cyclase